MRFSIASALALTLGAVLLVGCGGGQAASTTRYYCPMHPSYVADRPGDCPICNMKLVRDDGEHQAATQAGHETPPAPDASAAPPSPSGKYICTMCPEVVSDQPGRCPVCGMKLVEKKAESTEGGTEIAHASEAPAADASPSPPGMAPLSLGSEATRLAGVQLATARAERAVRTVRTVGYVTVDETRVRHVHTKLAGWIERLHVNAVGQPVRAGQPLVDLYSPELVASQEELLRAHEAAARLAASSLPEVQRGIADLVEAARRRLRLLDVPAGFLEELERTGRVRRTVTLTAPFGGTVTAKTVVEGHQVEPGTELFTLTDLSRVWVVAEVHEQDAALVRVGQEVELTRPNGPAARLGGRVALIEPTLDPASRTLRLRLELPNPDLALRPGMFVDATIRAGEVAGVAIPDSAVLDTGTRQLVFVRTGDVLAPREVRVTMRESGTALVASGVAAGEQVATRAVFLLDSESRLRALFAAPPPSTERPGGGR
ncbi:MAG: efflux RND transporter periplasmic adaptor subunit [Thermoanaerobaculaceae bacterium]|nr:efflux RND transporter periplasmic adaptor subunit [Thermoanaerobaculaceae bacterium]MDI9621651.1 efflux RND transporter periplasmic adaptor subunit [Acidobacteriota bacterium]NLH10767.1 efflux RND transporter periplasmic adaptor subunit [Holophagae bacterium]